MHVKICFVLQLQKFGSIEKLYIYYHRVTKKHLGLARIVFDDIKGARMCVDEMNGKSVMGQVLEAFIDPLGDKCKAIYKDLTTERPKELKPKVDVIKIKNEVELEKPLLNERKSFYDVLR